MYWLKSDDDDFEGRIGIEYTKELKRYLLNEMPHRFYAYRDRLYEKYPDKGDTGFSLGDDLFGWYLTTINDEGMLFYISKKSMDSNYAAVPIKKGI